jgi:hypothetical protein
VSGREGENKNEQGEKRKIDRWRHRGVRKCAGEKREIRINKINGDRRRKNK